MRRRFISDPSAFWRRARFVESNGGVVQTSKSQSYSSYHTIGVSDFHPDHVMDIITFNEVVPAVSRIETYPFNQQIEMRIFLAENGVQIESWGPFAEDRNNPRTSKS